jgi:hypothetical protein
LLGATSDCCRNCRDHFICGAEWSQPHNKGAVNKFIHEVRCDLNCQPGLAYATWPNQSQQTAVGLAQQAHDVV